MKEICTFTSSVFCFLLLAAHVVVPPEAVAGPRWKVSCSYTDSGFVDTCAAENGDLRVVFTGSGPRVSFGSDHFPNTEVEVKIDNKESLSWDSRSSSPELMEKIVQQMKAGRQMLTRYIGWPSKQVVEQKYSLIGFTSAAEKARAKVAAR